GIRGRVRWYVCSWARDADRLRARPRELHPLLVLPSRQSSIPGRQRFHATLLFERSATGETARDYQSLRTSATRTGRRESHVPAMWIGPLDRSTRHAVDEKFPAGFFLSGD